MRIRLLVPWANTRPRRRRPWITSLVGTLLLGWSGVASAAPITATYLTSTTFPSGPNPTISIQLTVTYDPTISGPLTISSFSSAILDAGFPVVGQYLTSGAGDGELLFGDNYYMSTYYLDAPLQFVDVFGVDANGAVDDEGGLRYAGADFMYSRYGTAFETGLYGSPLQIVTEITTTVPEPVTLTLLGPLTAVLVLKRRHWVVSSNVPTEGST